MSLMTALATKVPARLDNRDQLHMTAKLGHFNRFRCQSSASATHKESSNEKSEEASIT